ncbi:hypothetical protein FEM48_Zijuj05G0063100 [Ziziphus jujuba var. spinosa]|uniref:Uncharacterized protein n=1 Tax=Ziziphus jujuba var. spinosa TaxID=714518 RepID=A0A978VDA9_ZIZJJ|nr:hypothetical protein FEM48_Zijuj05G0063100 [Ziziphus jujuba var. spinosa]
MFAAGSDTTSTALERAMTELLRRPEIMHKLKTEIRSIAGSKTFITEDDLEAMVYLKAVIKETVRLHPPLPFLVPRASRTKVEIDGYEIKQGYQVYINAWAIGRDPISWEIPEEFEPDRRGFPRTLLAMAVNEIALANLVHGFDWGLPGGASVENLDIAETTGLTIHRKFPLIALPSLYRPSTSLKAITQESLPLYPLMNPLKMLSGHDIVAGTVVITNAWTTGRDPNLLEKQELLLANVVHKFDWSLADGENAQDLDMTECTGLTIHRKVPLLVVATPRF